MKRVRDSFPLFSIQADIMMIAKGWGHFQRTRTMRVVATGMIPGTHQDKSTVATTARVLIAFHPRSYCLIFAGSVRTRARRSGNKMDEGRSSKIAVVAVRRAGALTCRHAVTDPIFAVD